MNAPKGQVFSHLNRCCAAAALLCAAVSAHADDVFHGHCDGSAGAYLGQGQFVIADDDSPDLFIIDRATQASRPVRLAEGLGSIKPKKGHQHKVKEPDTEGAALIGDRIYWISSHGQKRDKDEGQGAFEDDPFRLRFFATTVVKRGKALELRLIQPYRDDLKKSLLKASAFKVLADAAKRGPEEAQGFNIEGLAAGPDGSLLIGFRNPLPAGRALLLPLKNPAEVIDKGHAFQWGDLMALDLGGRGIRSIEKVGMAWLIIAGPTGAPTPPTTPVPPFALFSWAGKAASKPLLMLCFDDPRWRPEAMFVDTDRKELVLLSDDGDETSRKVRCKKLQNAADKSFKVKYLKLPLVARSVRERAAP